MLIKPVSRTCSLFRRETFKCQGKPGSLKSKVGSFECLDNPEAEVKGHFFEGFGFSGRLVFL